MLAGLLIGAAGSRATVRLGLSRDDLLFSRARSRKWTAVAAYAALGLVAGLLAVFLPGPQAILHVRWLYVFGVVAILGFLGLRFKRSVGVLMVVVAVAGVVAIVGLIGTVRALTGERELATVQVLSVEEEMVLEVQLPERPPEVLRIAGTHFAPVVKVVIFDDVMVVLGARTWFRFEGILGFTTRAADGSFDPQQVGGMHPVDASAGIAQWLWELAESNEWFWGIKSAQIEVDLKRARSLQTYRLLLQNDGGLQIVDP